MNIKKLELISDITSSLVKLDNKGLHALLIQAEDGYVGEEKDLLKITNIEFQVGTYEVWYEISFRYKEYLEPRSFDETLHVIHYLDGSKVRVKLI